MNCSLVPESVLSSLTHFFNTGFSLCGWFKSTQLNSNNYGLNTIVSKPRHIYGSGYNISANSIIDGVNFERFVDGCTSSSVSSSSPGTIQDNEWHFVVGVFENNEMRLYYDGDFKASGNDFGASGYEFGASGDEVGSSGDDVGASGDDFWSIWK